MRQALLFVAFACAATAALAPAAGASQLIDRDATGVQLLVNSKGEGLITYSAGGQVKHVLAWGAVNALPPTRGGKQVAFQLDYTGGWGKYYLADPDVQRGLAFGNPQSQMATTALIAGGTAAGLAASRMARSPDVYQF